MNIKKRLLAMVMALAMVLAYMPAAVYAEGEDTGDGVSETGGAIMVNMPTEVVCGTPLNGVIGTDEIENLYTNGSCFTVTYADESTVDYEYKEGSYMDDNGVEHFVEGFFPEGQDFTEDAVYLYAELDTSEEVIFEPLNNKAKLMVRVPYYVLDEQTEEQLYVEYTNMVVDVNVWCSYDKPVSISFEPAEGNELEGYIGYNYIDETFFYGEGNKFVVEMEYPFASEEGIQTGSTLWDYEYHKEETEDGTVEGFFVDYGLPDVEAKKLEFDGDIFQEVYLEEGNNEVTIPFTAYTDYSDEPIELEFTVNITANKYDAYANWPMFEYTGKYITKTAFAKKLVVTDSDDNVIDEKEYTIYWTKQKKIGWYQAEIKFNDTTKYPESISADFSIGPKTPKITKVAGAKKSLKITWKKFTKSQLKNIDGMYIEVAQNKNFTKGYKLYTVSKKALKKSNYKTIKKLTGNKKYYVRLSTYKKVKQSGSVNYVFSPDSAIKAGKTKK